MVVLNKAKGISVGGGLVKTVTVGTKKIWPSRTIIGYRVVAEFEASSIFMDKQLRVNADPKALKPYSGVKNLQVRAKGKSQSLAATVKFMDWWVDIDVEGKLSTIGISSGTVCELLAPIYST